MKRFYLIILAFIFGLTVAFSGCHFNQGSIDDVIDEPTVEEPPIEEQPKEEPPVEEPPTDDDTPLYAFTPDGELTEEVRDRQASINALSATDDFNRSFGYTDGFKKDKYVCLFYFAWLGQEAKEMTGVYDISKLMNSNAAALWNTDGTTESPLNQYHFWGEPLYGYYNSLDPWVIRRHIELFIAAGIDCLVFDATNAHCYFPVIEQVASILLAYQNQGWNVPRFMFYTNTNSNSTVRTLYQGTGYSANALEREGIYRNGNYKSLWFAPDGKPQIVAVTSGLDGDLKNYFDVWESTWPSPVKLGEPYLSNGFPWIDWTGAPAHKGVQTMTGTAKGGVMSVSVAQHNRAPFSNAINTMNGCNIEEERKYMWGRGYTRTNKANHTDEAINSGLNFEEEWELALSNTPKYVHVTGWNEWVALKSVNPVSLPNAGAFFVDQANMEYSRDAEMMKGGYADNFYLQIARNVRNYKGVVGVQSTGVVKTVDIKSGLSQWNDVTSIYDDFTITDIVNSGTANVGANAVNRNFINFSGTQTLTDNTLINDVKSVRVTNDGEYIYFLVECVDDIVGTPALSDNRFMNLLISVDGQDNGNALGGFNYIVNRQSSLTGECSVESISKLGSKLIYEQTGEGAFSLGGRYMQFCVSRQSLGIKENQKFTIGFKVADNVTDPEDMQFYYISGECAPVGRLGYTYKGI